MPYHRLPWRSWLPPLLLAVYALAFAWHALAGGLLVVDDHPGQLYRLAHVVDLGPWPWRFNPGWWAGYAELQYYPPGAAYAGAGLHLATLGALGLDAIYQILLWIVFFLPGAATYLLLVRLLSSPWLALPGAFLALTLSGGSRSGVEEGLRWGLVAARLGWALLPLLALALRRWTERETPPLAAAWSLAAIVLTHPAHAPAGLCLVFLAASQGPGRPSARMTYAAAIALAAGGSRRFLARAAARPPRDGAAARLGRRVARRAGGADQHAATLARARRGGRRRLLDDRPSGRPNRA